MGYTTKKMGMRIQDLRQQKGLSQNDLAKQLGIQRTAISSIEQGKRSVKAEEIFKLSEIFQISCEIIMNPEKEPKILLEEAEKREAISEQIRISVPQKRVDKFKEVLLYILNKVGSKPNIGETVIYKILYFIDFDFYEKYEEQLIGASYVKDKYGPTPYEFRAIVDKIIEDKEIIELKNVDYHGYKQNRYVPLREPDLKILKANEVEIIDKVLNKLSDMSAKQISEYSHSDVPWLTTDDDKIIDYESVFYRTPAYSMRDYNDDEV
jgi:transcriptional regulator with XRE-family HTH domain